MDAHNFTVKILDTGTAGIQKTTAPSAYTVQSGDSV